MARGFFRTLWHRNVIQFGAIYLGVSWLLLQVAMALEEALKLPDYVDQLTLVFLTIGFPLVLILAWAQESRSEAEEDNAANLDAEKSEVALPDRLSLAVLPFRVLSSEEDHQYLADGLSEDISNTLSFLPQTFVVDYSSSAAYAGDVRDVRKAGEALGASYIVNGSLRRAQDNLRITARLSDARTAQQLWTGKYEQPKEAFFNIQDDIVDEISRLIADQSHFAEDHRIKTKHPKNLNAYEALRRSYIEGGHLSFAAAKEMLYWAEKAIELDEDYAHAHSIFGQYLISFIAFGYSDDPAKDLEKADKHFKIAQQLAPEDVQILCNLSQTAILHRRFDKALEYARNAVAINNNYAATHGVLGVALTYGPEPWKAIDELKIAERYAPKSSSRVFWSYARGVAHYVMDEFAEAETAIYDAIEHGLGEHWPVWFSLAYVLEAQGKRDNAVDALKNSVKNAPGSSFEGYQSLVDNYFNNRPRHKEALATLRTLWPEAYPTDKA